MKKTRFLFILMASATTAFAQQGEAAKEQRPDFILSGNLSSGASLFSVGFEKLFFIKSNVVLAAKVGFGYNQEFQLFSSEPPTNYFVMPHHVTCNFGMNKSYLELGAGGSLVRGGGQTYYLVFPILGYRYHPFRNPGFSFRAWLYFPFGQDFITEYNEVLFAPVGLSFGIAL